MKTIKGARKMALSIMQRINDQTDAPSSIELGTIQGDMSLLLDRFSAPIPQSDYLICRSLTLPDPLVMTAESGAEPDHTHDVPTIGETSPAGAAAAHSHSVPLPSKMAPLKPGDRVLVVWAHDEDAVIVDVII